jgi:DnaJ-class molecular chaperone
MTDDTYHGGPAGNCPACKGNGYAYGDPDGDHGSCHHCSGTGHVSADEAAAIAAWLTSARQH